MAASDPTLDDALRQQRRLGHRSMQRSALVLTFQNGSLLQNLDRAGLPHHSLDQDRVRRRFLDIGLDFLQLREALWQVSVLVVLLLIEHGSAQVPALPADGKILQLLLE